MRISILYAPVVMSCLWLGSVSAAEPTEKVVRIAQLVIDPAQLAAYQVAVKEEMAESIRIEPGVLAIYSVAEKDHSNRLHFFEIYADEAAYRNHIASTAHFPEVRDNDPVDDHVQSVNRNRSGSTQHSTRSMIDFP